MALPPPYIPVRALAQKIEKAVLGVRKVPRVGQKAELAVQEYDRVPGLEEVLCRGGAAGAGGEVVDEADGLLFEGDGGAAGGDEDDAPVGEGVGVDEG